VAAEALRELSQRKADLLAFVSHELRAPLTVIGGFADTLLKDWASISDEVRLELVGRVATKGEEMRSLVEQFLDFSRLDANAVNLAPRPHGLRGAVAASVAKLAPAMSAHRVEIDVPLVYRVYADPDALDTVLANLLSNAIKFSPPGSTIRIGAAPHGRDVVVSVTDQGVGLAAEEQGRIFERYYRAPTNGSTRGSGLGLHISSRLVELMGGRIWVDSEPGHGSTFFVALHSVVRDAGPLGVPEAADGHNGHRRSDLSAIQSL
jgi:signal transduction histidine kinase